MNFTANCWDLRALTLMWWDNMAGSFLWDVRTVSNAMLLVPTCHFEFTHFQSSLRAASVSWWPLIRPLMAIEVFFSVPTIHYYNFISLLQLILCTAWVFCASVLCPLRHKDSKINQATAISTLQGHYPRCTMQPTWNQTGIKYISP